MRISYWSSDVCSSDLFHVRTGARVATWSLRRGSCLFSDRRALDFCGIALVVAPAAADRLDSWLVSASVTAVLVAQTSRVVALCRGDLELPGRCRCDSTSRRAAALPDRCHR